MYRFTMNSMTNPASAAARAEANSACAKRSFNIIALLIDISLLMSIFVILAGLILVISAGRLALAVIGGIIICLILGRSFIPHRGRTVVL